MSVNVRGLITNQVLRFRRHKRYHSPHIMVASFHVEQTFVWGEKHERVTTLKSVCTWSQAVNSFATRNLHSMFTSQNIISIYWWEIPSASYLFCFLRQPFMPYHGVLHLNLLKIVMQWNLETGTILTNSVLTISRTLLTGSISLSNKSWFGRSICAAISASIGSISSSPRSRRRRNICRVLSIILSFTTSLLALVSLSCK